MLEKRLQNWSGWPWVVGLVGGILGLQLAIYLGAEGLWFQDVGYPEVFRLRVMAQGLLGVLAFGVSATVLAGNLFLSSRLPALPQPVEARSRSPILGLSALVTAVLTLALLICLQLLYLGRAVASYWSVTTSVYDTTSPLPLWARPAALKTVLAQLAEQPWQLGAIAGVAIALLLLPRFCTLIAALGASVALSVILSEQWTRVLPALNPTPFQRTEPLFEQDISFYIFRLPCLEVLAFWFINLVFFALVSVLLRYLLSGRNLSEGAFRGFSGAQQRHLYGLAGVLMLATGLGHWLERYQLLYSGQGVVYGASYTDVHVSLPVYTGLSAISLLLSLALLARTLFWPVGLSALIPRLKPLPQRSLVTRPLLWGIGLYLLLTLLGGMIAPQVVQRLVVLPNELQRETPYIQRAINLTRDAFNLSTINSEFFVPGGELTLNDLERNNLTVDNIRLWDTRPLLQSNRQLQQIRLYYEFADADVDRYRFNEGDREARRQVLISARELNYARVPAEAQTWVNQHLVYTHGYGFTMSPVNTAAEDGLPTYFIKGIDHTPSNEAVQRSIPVEDPRIYFGELTDTYIMTNTQVRELDYPSSSDNVYTTYGGRSGIAVADWRRRLLFASHLRDWQMLFTEDFTPQTRLSFRRRIGDRVQALAPFLRFDDDPYLVVADIEEDARRWGTQPPETPPELAASADESYLYWVIDAYTTSDRYPYSDPGNNDFNYIRNSVKVVVDAYHGSVKFFVADPSDPIIQTWSRLLPGMFASLEAMPDALRQHLRYPQDYYQVQSRQLMTYHMTDPQVFYNREDQWRAPNEIYGNEAQRVEPYYLIMKLPAEDNAEFILLRPFTPAQRNNLVAWLAARSDGDRYGRMLLYRFPKQELLFGPEQIEARINQDPEISQRISLWNTQGSRAKQGNLLVIPIERSLLYVEPLYLEAEQNSLPTLARVILVYRNRIAMAETLSDAISAIFEGDRETAPPVLRELELTLPDLQTPLPSLTPTPAEEEDTEPEALPDLVP